MREVAQRSRWASCSEALIRVNGRGGPPVAKLNSALSNKASSCFKSFALAASSGARKASAFPATSTSAGAGAAGRPFRTPASSEGTSAPPRARTRSATAAKTEYSAGLKNRSGCFAGRSRVLRSASGTVPAAASSAAPATVFFKNPRRVSIAAGILSEEDLRDGVQRGVDRLELGGRFLQRDADDLVPAQGGHLAELPARDHVRRVHAEAGGQDAVEGARSASALDVSQDGDARLVPGALLDHVGDLLADAAQAHVPELVELLAHRALLLSQLGALGDHHDREVLPLRPVPVADVVANLLDVDGPLGDEDHVGSAGHSGMGRYPACVQIGR